MLSELGVRLPKLWLWPLERKRPMSKVLVVGGAGYVGGYLTDLALEQGHEVRVFDKLLYEDAYLKDVDFHFGDILDRHALKTHLNWADTVVWLAAVVGDPACALNPELTINTNVNSLKSLVADYSGRIIFLSTCSIYGAQLGLLTEESPFDPLSLYAESKIAAEKVLLESLNEVLIFRLGTLFGLSDTYSRIRVDLVLNVLTIRAVQEGHMSVFGGQQYRPLLHVRDVATAVVPQIDTKATGVYNLHAENMTIIQLAERIKKLVPSATIEITESSFQDARNYMVSTDKAAKELGFKPRWTVEDGIGEIRDTISAKRIPKVNIPRFSNVAALQSQFDN
jgi:nucleoside-diphosphate-sugar epimerase